MTITEKDCRFCASWDADKRALVRLRRSEVLISSLT
jgi:hypothetical protein